MKSPFSWCNSDTEAVNYKKFHFSSSNMTINFLNHLSNQKYDNQHNYGDSTLIFNRYVHKNAQCENDDRHGTDMKNMSQKSTPLWSGT